MFGSLLMAICIMPWSTMCSTNDELSEIDYIRGKIAQRRLLKQSTQTSKSNKKGKSSSDSRDSRDSSDSNDDDSSSDISERLRDFCINYIEMVDFEWSSNSKSKKCSSFDGIYFLKRDDYNNYSLFETIDSRYQFGLFPILSEYSLTDDQCDNLNEYFSDTNNEYEYTLSFYDSKKCQFLYLDNTIINYNELNFDDIGECSNSSGHSDYSNYFYYIDANIDDSSDSKSDDTEDAFTIDTLILCYSECTDCPTKESVYEFSESNLDERITLGNSAKRTITITSDDIDNAKGISDMNVYIYIEHMDITDLEITLEHKESNTIIYLQDNLDCEGYYDTDETVWFDDDGNISIDDFASQCVLSIPDIVTINGTFIPKESLSSFNGLTPVSEWQLIVDDNDGSNTGYLQEWILQIYPTF